MDLTTEEGVLQYLQSALYKTAYQVTRLPEGSCGFIYRTKQSDPKDPLSVIVKHVQGYAARATHWKLDQNRLEYEYKALRTIPSLNLGTDGIQVPKVLHFDKEAWVLVIEDAGEDVSSLKSWLQPNCDLDEAAAIGARLGKFLAAVHNVSAGNEALLKEFIGNETARKLSKAVYFSNLANAAAKFGHTGDHIKQAAQQGEKDVQEVSEVLTIGDFWTGNVLITKDQRLFVVDLELAKPGTADFDVGQMAAEMYSIAAFRTRAVGMSILNAFFLGYKQSRNAEVDVAKVAIRIGAHFVGMWSPWTAEASQEEIDEHVNRGEELIRLGVARDMGSLKHTLVQSLLS